MPMLDQAFTTPALPYSVIAIRLALALVLGAVIGFEREAQNRPAGLRTHMLVSLAAALFTIVAIDVASSRIGDESTVRFDPIRVIEAVTAGVAFLAAGAILRVGTHVQGITTGAALWLAGAAGVACGVGLGLIAVGVSIVSLVVLSLLQRIERHLGSERQ